jgi:hypothetical protein
VKAVVSGAIATYPVGGMAWHYGQYALGLERLGFEVYYLEDIGIWLYDPTSGDRTTDPSYGLEFLQESLAALSSSLAPRWHYRGVDGESHGLDAAIVESIVHDADVFINVSGICLLRDEYMPCRRKLLVDTDPGYNHFVEYPRWDDAPLPPGLHSYRDHDFFFTYAGRLGRPGCRLPDLGIEWHPTRQPVILDEWSRGADRGRWTTIMTWNPYERPVVHEGVLYGAKDMQFQAVEGLPRRASAPFELAVTNRRGPSAEDLRELGWSVVDAFPISRTAESYRRYIQDSRGEFSVAKNMYVATGSGWFSERSACYLASSRPVVLEDTGFSELISHDAGLLAFSDLDGAVEAVARVEREYDLHAEAARDVARTHFAAEIVLGEMLDRVGLGGL